MPAPLAVHPEALESLVKAETGLVRALVQYGSRRRDDEQALAQEMLGNILMLKAEYHRASAIADKQEARNTWALADRSASMVQTYAALERYYDQLAALSDRDLTATVSAAQQAAAKAKTEAEAAQAEITSLRDRAGQLRQTDERLIPQVRKLRMDSEQATGQKAMELMDQALKLESQVNENVSALGALENALDRRETDLGDLTAALASAESRRKIAEAIISARKGHAASSRSEKESIEVQLTKARADLQDEATRLAGVCERIAQAEDTAATAYTQAIVKHEGARRLRPRGQDAATTARLADARWALAEMKDQSLDLRQRNLLLLARLAAASSPGATTGPQPLTTASATAPALTPEDLAAVPAFAKGILAYVPNPEQTRAEAIENYQQAGTLYETASRQVPSQLRWAYQGQAAAAYIALYRLSHDPEARAKAKEALDQALENKRESPFLASVVELERLFQTSTSQPESQPGGSVE